MGLLDQNQLQALIDEEDGWQILTANEHKLVITNGPPSDPNLGEKIIIRVGKNNELEYDHI